MSSPQSPGTCLKFPPPEAEERFYRGFATWLSLNYDRERRAFVIMWEECPRRSLDRGLLAQIFGVPDPAVVRGNTVPLHWPPPASGAA